MNDDSYDDLNHDSDDDSIVYFPRRYNVSFETSREDEHFNTDSDGQNSDTDPEDMEEFGQYYLCPNTETTNFIPTNCADFYVNVIDSILRYGAPIWSHGAGTLVGMRRAEATHRRACLRVISGRPHLSYDATYVLASIPPLALLADERSRLYRRRHEDARAEERQETLRRWQSRWDRSTKGRWTHRLIPNISLWIDRRHGEVDYHLTQLPTGHSYFKHHSQRYDHNTSADCPACPNTVENAEHIFFHCTRFEEGREKLHHQLQEVSRPENIVQLMLADKKNWLAVATFAKSVITSLRAEEMARRG
ncbi:hypothetical protein TKK_0004745 [Trichogramma kaykai]